MLACAGLLRSVLLWQIVVGLLGTAFHVYSVVASDNFVDFIDLNRYVIGYIKIERFLNY